MDKATASVGVRSDSGPFAIVPEWVLYHEEITANAIRLYAVLGRYADSDSKAFPSRRTLAKRCDCSVDTIDRSLGVLRDVGAVVVTRRQSETGDLDSNMYLVIRRDPRPGGGTDAATGGGTDAATGSRTGAAENESHYEREPEERDTPAAPVLRYDPLKGVRVDGQDLPWNALAEETDAGGKAYGPRMKRALDSIRADIMWWLEATSSPIKEPYRPEEFEQAIAETITVVARRLKREAGVGLTWGPEGIARNFRRGLALIQGSNSIGEIVADVERAS